MGEGDPLEFGHLSSETRDAFYGALGNRLIQSQRLADPARSDALRNLLEASFRLGPRGLDAGTFSAAIAVGIDFDIRLSPEFRNYRSRLALNRELRLSLMPMLNALCSEKPTRSTSG